MSNLFERDDVSAFDAISSAQWIAWAPVIFQAAKCLKSFGILAYIDDKKNEGASIAEVAAALELSVYGVRVLMEAGLGLKVFYIEEERYKLAKTGYYLLHDKMTEVNMNFVDDICYKPMAYLHQSIETGTPVGLHELGDWNTVYEGLSSLKEPEKKSWFDFDNFYSDLSFNTAARIILSDNPKTVFDFGGNSGKFSIECCRLDSDVELRLFDHPGQLNIARKNIVGAGVSDRVSYHPIDFLKLEKALDDKADIVWMSQFLDCFSEDEIVDILKFARSSLDKGGVVYILEAFWDRQKFEAAALSLQMTSLYFTAVANGNSQMYGSREFLRCIDRAGLKVVEEFNNIGVSHTLIKCIPQ